MDCLFCKIVNKTLPCQIVYEDEHTLAFNDIQPVAPQHVLIIPKKHIASLNDITEEHALLLGQTLLVPKLLAKQFDVAERGYRLISNCGPDAHQSVFHIHFHFIAGRQMSWPPG
ncbi:MAG: hypothetical protein ACD_44C00066G0004 [uncultured bacterium]|nr:MAG: hypothetical protein ACD_44C00066G0004 [uncultured bacterium]OGT16819.1 MAG: histidine triad nucleotide-binding protein [Gammaproteobacteria bacterium RIFCSPHIGHO2_02_FULL_38_33]OGT24777.1 MAG: histidine triad nucleotide-binding protein [Gammaproteobacteria bacterium RIFCSPHIGHO2_12_38_15]OGT67472.1 MAG: histidine triad nucleotide-binding protein [Gammaproteobacteria bacterium RIFCSPLOWO2_02_FULL_38_11]OGT76174.1 MAG: histidine triad nucleotide-binding protein [Gammaproteobacteria bacte